MSARSKFKGGAVYWLGGETEVEGVPCGSAAWAFVYNALKTDMAEPGGMI